MKKEIMKMLEDLFGIKDERELNIALQKAEKLNIGIMTTRSIDGEYKDKQPQRVRV